MELSVKSIKSPDFKPYGQVLAGYDFSGVFKIMEKLPCPSDSVVYVPSEPMLEADGVFAQLGNNYFGGMPIEMGYCNGYNTKLNCLEYHRDSEVNIAQTDFIALLGKQELISDWRFDTGKVEAFLVPAGTAVEFYATALHYAPCSKSNSVFRVAVVLPRGTNFEKPKINVLNAEDKLLAASNKWLLAHKDADEAKNGAHVGLDGVNIDIAQVSLKFE
jgi:hypothetical protein